MVTSLLRNHAHVGQELHPLKLILIHNAMSVTPKSFRPLTREVLQLLLTQVYTLPPNKGLLDAGNVAVGSIGIYVSSI